MASAAILLLTLQPAPSLEKNMLNELQIMKLWVPISKGMQGTFYPLDVHLLQALNLAGGLPPTPAINNDQSLLRLDNHTIT